jgi:hypothetical protein
MPDMENIAGISHRETCRRFLQVVPRHRPAADCSLSKQPLIQEAGSDVIGLSEPDQRDLIGRQIKGKREKLGGAGDGFGERIQGSLVKEMDYGSSSAGTTSVSPLKNNSFQLSWKS